MVLGAVNWSSGAMHVMPTPLRASVRLATGQ